MIDNTFILEPQTAGSSLHAVIRKKNVTTASGSWKADQNAL